MFLEPPQPPVPFPNPLITEILYAVPTAKSVKGDLSLCDANKDGARDATGDEFIELVNPHDKPIKLGGYTLTDHPGSGKKPAPQFRFTFPAMELQPGQVVVVFNGFQQSWTGPVGDSSKAAAPNDRFHNALVLTLRAKSSRSGLANGGDWVLLSAPDGRPVECVKWGNTEGEPPRGALIEEAPVTESGSVQRDGPAGAFVPHRSLGGPYDGHTFSPGQFGPQPPAAAPTPATSTPAPEPTPDGKR